MNPVLSGQITGICPLNTGCAVLDQLMAALAAENDATGLDQALDLRLALAEDESTAILDLYFRLRNTLGDRHYLACYRLRRWLEGQFVALVSPSRREAGQAVGLRLDAADFAALRRHCLACAGLTADSWEVRVRYLPQAGARQIG